MLEQTLTGGPVPVPALAARSVTLSIISQFRGDYSGATAYVFGDVVRHSSSGATYVAIAPTTGNAPPNATFWFKLAEDGDDGVSGSATGFVRADRATTANITIATALNSGDSLDGGVLANNELVFVKNQTDPAENGLYVVGAVPVRHADYDTYDEHCGAIVVVKKGTANADKIFQCTSDPGGTLGTTALTFVDKTVPQATTTVPGVIEIATDAEILAGTDADRAVQSAGLRRIIGMFRGDLADDAVVTFPVPPGDVGSGIIGVLDARYRASFGWDTLATYDIQPTAENAAVAANIDWTTGALSAGGGTDTHLTISIHTNDLIYMSNRLGGSVEYLIILFGA